MFRAIFMILLLCSITTHSIAQQTYTITGTVKDKKETLPGASIYVSGYKIATLTNNEGKFVIPNLKPGNYDILVQMIGYFPVSKNVILSDQPVNINILLSENTTQLNEVVIKPDPDRDYYISMFKDDFIGRSPNTAQCKILNTNVLIVDMNKTTRVLTIKANDLLIIENLALGYRIKYLLENFEHDYRTKIVYYSGYPTYEEMKGGKAKQKKWKKNREIAYLGSSDHFFKALYENKTAEEGYIINKRSEILNTNRMPDSLINAKIKQLTTGRDAVGNLIRFNGGSDSLSYWMKQRAQPKKMNILNRAPVVVDTLVKKYDKVLKMINFKDELYIIYQRERESDAYEFSGHQQARPLDVGNFQISVVTMWEPPAYFYPNGSIANTRSLLYSGYWSYEKMADSVPMDYVYIPQKK
jgi:hypothetical protein